MNILVTGGRGLLGQALIPALTSAGHTVMAPERDALDLRSADAIRRGVDEAARAEGGGGLDWIVNCAAWTNVDGAESDPSGAFALNRDAPRVLAESAARVGARLLHLSTDYVFSGVARARGSSRRPWRECDPRAPLSVYGQSKAEGEDAVLSVAAARPLVVRTSWLYGGGGRNFVDTVRERLMRGEVLRVVEDQLGRPTWTKSLSAMLVGAMTVSPAAQILHLADDGVASWHGLAVAVAAAVGVPEGRVVAVRTVDRPSPAPRPAWSTLDLTEARTLLGQAGLSIPRWRDSLAAYLGTAKANAA